MRQLANFYFMPIHCSLADVKRNFMRIFFLCEVLCAVWGLFCIFEIRKSHENWTRFLRLLRKSFKESNDGILNQTNKTNYLNHLILYENKVSEAQTEKLEIKSVGPKITFELCLDFLSLRRIIMKIRASEKKIIN